MSKPVKAIYEPQEDALDGVSNQASATYASFRDQAGEAADEARSTVAALAGEARAKIAEMVDQQKAAGANQVAGVAGAAQAAAGELRDSSPQLARLVDSVAGRVDDVAENIRRRDVADVIGILSDFGRRRPLAFFGSAVLAGFLVARFLRSDALSGQSGGRSFDPSS